MSNTNSVFNKAVVRVPNKSGFNQDHEVLTTLPVGSLVPVLCDEICPNTTVKLGALANLELPPFATNYNGKVDLRLESFFVPYRLLWDGWKSFISRQNQYDPAGTVPATVPVMGVNGGSSGSQYTGAKLTTSLGMRTTSMSTGNSRNYNALNALAYHRIWNDWYRDSRIQKSAFSPLSGGVAGSLPWTFATQTMNENTPLADTVTLGSLRQRLYAKDYFTTAQLKQSLGENLRVSVGFLGNDSVERDLNKLQTDGTLRSTTAPSANVIGGTGFTIAQLREINTLQNYMDTLGACGNKYEDVMRAVWGCSPADEVVNKPVYLGSSSIGVYAHGVGQAFDNASATKNIYAGNPGATFGQANANGGASLGNFTAREFGCIMVIASVVPHAYYSSVTDRKYFHSVPSDFATGALANAGNQPIWVKELDPALATTNNAVFGWTDRYAEYKFKHDNIYNGFMDGACLDAWKLSRDFESANPSLGTSFLEIPKTALDDVLAVTTSDDVKESRLDIFFKYSVSAPLPVYSIPTLDGHYDTHAETVSRAGKRL